MGLWVHHGINLLNKRCGSEKNRDGKVWSTSGKPAGTLPSGSKNTGRTADEENWTSKPSSSMLMRRITTSTGTTHNSTPPSRIGSSGGSKRPSNSVTSGARYSHPRPLPPPQGSRVPYTRNPISSPPGVHACNIGNK